jgi:hypothetical protein
VSRVCMEAIGFNPSFSPSENAVLQKLAWHAKKDGSSIFPKAVDIVTWTGLSRAMVFRVLDGAEREGLIAKVGKRGRITEYRMDTAAIQAYESLPGRLSKVYGVDSASTTKSLRDRPASLPGRPSPPLPTPPLTVSEQSGKSVENSPDFYDLLKSSFPNHLPVKRERAKAWLEEWGITASKALDVVVDMQSALVWNKRKDRWEYLDKGGKLRTYGNCWATFQKWVRRPSLNGRQPVDLSSPDRLDQIKALADAQEAERMGV